LFGNSHGCGESNRRFLIVFCSVALLVQSGGETPLAWHCLLGDVSRGKFLLSSGYIVYGDWGFLCRC